MNRLSLTLAGAVFALTFTGCDDKKKDEATPIAPVVQPVVAAPPEAAPAEPAKGEPHAAKPAKHDEKDKKDEPGTPEVGAPKAADAPAEAKEREAKGLKEDPTKERMGNKLPPPVPPQAEAPTSAPATKADVPAAGGRPGRALPAAFNQTDAGK